MLEWLFAGGPTMVPLLASVLASLIFERLLAFVRAGVARSAMELTPET